MRRYDASVVTHSVQPPPQKHLHTHSEQVNDSQHQSDQSAEGPEVAGDSQLASVGETSLDLLDEATREEASLQRGQSEVVAEPAKSLKLNDKQISNDPKKIQEQIAAKKAEMARLQAQLTKAKRDATRGDATDEDPLVKFSAKLL